MFARSSAVRCAILGIVMALNLAAARISLSASPTVASCFLSAANRYHLSPVLLYSIAWKESRLNDWAVNSNGDGTIDIGLMQVNSRWLPELAKYGISRQMLFDPCTNVSAGAWVLAKVFYQNGANWSSVGRYNSPDPGIGSVYAEEVHKIFNQAFGRSPAP